MKRERPLSPGRWLASLVVDLQFAWIATVGTYFSTDSLVDPSPKELAIIKRYANRKINVLLFDAARGKRNKRRRISPEDLVEKLSTIERTPYNSIAELSRLAFHALEMAGAESREYEGHKKRRQQRKT